MAAAVNGQSTRLAIAVLDVERAACPQCAPGRGICDPLKHDLGVLVADIIASRREQAVDELAVAA